MTRATTRAMTTAAAYERWLQIPPQQHPPHHYALLGLAPQTADQQAVFHAYQQRAAVVGQQLSGPHAQVALQLLGELAAAQACLLNSEARAAYDRALAQRTGVAATATTAANLQRPAPRGKAEPPTAAPPASSVASGDVVPPPSPYSEQGEPSSALPWLVGGVCAGLLAVAVLGVALFGWQRRAERKEVAANAAASVERDGDRSQTGDRDRPARGKDRRQQRDRDRDASLVAKLRDDDVLGERVAPLTTKPEHLDSSLIGPPDDERESAGDVVVDDEDDTSGSGEPTDEAPATTPDKEPPPPEPAPSSTKTALAELPRAIALPSRTAGGSGLLAQLPAKDPASVKLSLDASAVTGSKFALADEIAGLNPGERVWPVEAPSASGEPRAVGEYSLSGDELSFRWAESAQASDEVLANVALAVSFDDRQVQINQRSPEMAAPLRLSVESGAITATAKIDDPPPSAKLHLSLAAQDETFPAHKLQPEEAVAAGEEVDVIFGEATDPYRLALRVSFSENGAGGVRLEARPMFQTADEGLKWDYFRPKAVLQTLAQLKQHEALLDAQLAQLQQRFGRNPLQLQQATELYNRQATELQTRMLNLEQIHALCEQLNAAGALDYRVFAQLGEREIDLLDSTLGITVPVEAPPEAEDPSAIVGPPMKP